MASGFTIAVAGNFTHGTVVATADAAVLSTGHCVTGAIAIRGQGTETLKAATVEMLHEQCNQWDGVVCACDEQRTFAIGGLRKRSRRSRVACERSLKRTAVVVVVAGR